MWYLTNVVFYDGCDAFVSKFILETEKDGTRVTDRSEELLSKYLSGNGEILKIDILYRVDLDNIVAMKTAQAGDIITQDMKCAYNRFNEMFFNI